jgi:hypothetical protein
MRFVQVGDSWVNVDHITRVHVDSGIGSEPRWRVRVTTTAAPLTLPDNFPTQAAALDGARRFVERCQAPDFPLLLGALSAAAEMPQEGWEGNEPSSEEAGADPKFSLVELHALEVEALDAAKAAESRGHLLQAMRFYENAHAFTALIERRVSE